MVLSPAEMSKFSVLPPSVNAGINHKQAEVNRLTNIAQKWSTEAPLQYNQAPTYYNHDRMNTNTSRGRSI